MLICHLYIFVRYANIIGLFLKLHYSFFLIVKFEEYLFILDNGPLLDMSFANIFSKSVVYPFILLRVSFVDRKL